MRRQPSPSDDARRALSTALVLGLDTDVMRDPDPCSTQAFNRMA